jgi:hypothetical protein
MKKKMKTILENQIGCGEMNSFTFSLTVSDEVAGSDPMSEQDMRDYLWAIIESQSVVAVLNIVRDY